MSMGISASVTEPECGDVPSACLSANAAVWGEQLKTFKVARSYAYAHACLGNCHSAPWQQLFLYGIRRHSPPALTCSPQDHSPPTGHCPV